jgi:hypothetical protein
MWRSSFSAIAEKAMLMNPTKTAYVNEVVRLNAAIPQSTQTTINSSKFFLFFC